MVSKVVDRAFGALSIAAGVARHVAWYVSYQVGRTARADEPEPKPPARSR